MQNTPTEAATTALAMSEYRNTLACCFDPTSPRLTALDIHEWIHSQLQVSEHSVLMIQMSECHYWRNCLQAHHGRNLLCSTHDCWDGNETHSTGQPAPGTPHYYHTDGPLPLFRRSVNRRRNLGKALSIHCLKWGTDCHDDIEKTHSLIHHRHWV